MQLVSVWTQFKKRLADLDATFETFEVRENYLLQNDQTYLSLVDKRLREVTEQLLSLDRLTLPPHIQIIEFEAFLARFGFRCRAEDCSHTFQSLSERNAHELSHNSSFPCLQCDFSEFGFRTREGLKKHTQRYHTSPDSLDIPHSLQSCDESSRLIDFAGTNHPTNAGRLARSWSEQGRRASQLGFQKILAKIESETLASSSKSNQPTSQDAGQSPASIVPPLEHIDMERLRQGFSAIQGGIKEQYYSTLQDFKIDVETLLQKGLSSSSAARSIVNSICDEELAKLDSGFPDFAQINDKRHRLSNVLRHTGRLPDRAEKHPEDRFASVEVHHHVNPCESQARKTYWSLAEDKQLPDLLVQHGCNSAMIADCLKTKTLTEIEAHPLYLNSLNKLPLATPIEEVQSSTDAEDDVLPASSKDALHGDSISEPLVSDADPLGLQLGDWWPGFGRASVLTDAEPKLDEPSVLSSDRNNPEDNVNAVELAGQPKQKKKEARRPRARAKCNTCGQECYDQWVAVKHYNRFHVPTRKMWACKDRSLNKSFFSTCKSCTSGKIYASKHNAIRHLRETHFTKTTAEQIVDRWMDPVEGPNPNYQDRTSTSYGHFGRAPRAKQSFLTDPDISAHATKRRKVDQLPPIRNLHELDSGTNRLPAIRTTPSGADSTSRGHTPESPGSESEQDSQNSDPTTSQELDMLPDVSFDNLLPVGDSTVSISDASVDTLNKSWIRPSQVHRLPQLDVYQRAICLDQVEALYSVLTTNYSNSPRSKQAEEELTSLSQLLFKGLRSWRQRSGFAPSLPFSI